jgi:hypothetical protein
MENEIPETNIIEFESRKADEPWEEIICEVSKQGRRYWRKTGDVYCCDTVEDLRRWLKSRGHSASISKAEHQAGETLSEVDKAILKIQECRRVHIAGEFAGWHTGVHAISGRQVLVTEQLKIIKARNPGEKQPQLDAGETCVLDDKCHGWPNIGRIFQSRLHAGDRASGWQAHTCCAVIQRAYGALVRGRPKRCQAMVFAGDPSAGKSLFIDAILRPIMGDRAAYPLQYMLGQTDFNSEMHEAALWKVDDEATRTKISDRKHLAAKLKQAVAVKGARLHEKGKAAKEIETMNSLVFAVNLEEQNLLVLPPLDNDVEGKIHLFKYHNAEWPCWPLSEAAEEDANAAILRAELPYFLHWLTHKFEVPEEIWDQRFGVKSFYHEEILEKLDFLSNEARFWNLIERVLCRPIPNAIPAKWYSWEGTASELYQVLREHDDVSYEEKKHLPDPNHTMGKFLKKLAGRPSYTGCIEARREAGTGRRLWKLVSRDEVDAHKNMQNEEEKSWL